MTIFYFTCYKICTHIVLDKFYNYFNIKKMASWDEYIIIKGSHLDMILKDHTSTKQVYLFEFGCATFVNLDEYEIKAFLSYVSHLTMEIDSTSSYKYFENHSIHVDENSMFKLWQDSSDFFIYEKSVISIISVVLARSVALDRIATDVNQHLDKSEKYIDLLKNGKLHLNKKKSSTMTAQFLRFEYDIIKNIRIFERSISISHNLNSRQIFDSLAQYYQFHSRFTVLQSKLDDLRRTLKIYFSLSFKQNENRLLVFEIFLLALFPLFFIISHIFG